MREYVKIALAVGLATLNVSAVKAEGRLPEPTPDGSHQVELPFGKIIEGNIEGAKREHTVVDQVVRATTGISVRDIKKHGVFGGHNSVFHKPFG